MKELQIIQGKLEAPKNQRNNFGGYNYRSCEDILSALKQLLQENECVLTINDEMWSMGDRIYVKATATLINKDGKSISTSAFAREPLAQKGMNEAQITGSASSYARKYALNGLFAIDDTKDADATNTHGNTKQESKKQYNNNDDLPWIDDITMKKILENKESFIAKMGDGNNAVKEMRKKYKVATKYADQIKALF